MKLKQYALGGITYTPIDINASQQSAGAASASTGSTEKNPFISQLESIFKEHGLTNDFNFLMKYVDNVLDLSNSPNGENLNAYSLRKITNQANKVKRNFEVYGLATGALQRNNAFSDIALSDNGRIYVTDEEGNIGKIRLNEFDTNKYAALTNSELLKIRESNPDMTFDMGSLMDVANSVGYNDLMKHVKELISARGTNQIKGYTSKHTAEIDAGIQALLSIAPEGVEWYEFDLKSQFGADSETVEKALNYLYGSLNNKEQQLLDATAVVKYGVSRDKSKFLLMDMLTANSSSTRSIKMEENLDSHGNAKQSKGAGDKGDALTQGNYLQRISNGEFGPPRKISIVAKGSKPMDNPRITVTGWDLGAMVDKDMKRLFESSLTELTHNAEGLKGADLTSITFGNRLVEKGEQDAIYYDGNSDLCIVQLPYTRSDDGRIIPDFSMMRKIDNLNQFAKNRSISEVQQYIEENFEYPDKITNENGNYKYTETDTLPFFTFNAWAGKDVFKFTDDDKLYLEPVSKTVGRLIKDKYNNIINYGKIHVDKKDKKINDYDEAESGDFYQGNIYIPYTNHYGAWNVSGVDDWYTKDTFTDVSAKMQVRDAEHSRNVLNGDVAKNWS